jgi:hypothetical protein
LNPVRAKLFDLEGGDLADYRWSSYLLYSRPSKRPAWLDVERSLGCLGLEDGSAGRGRYREYMQKRVLEIASSEHPMELDADWAKIRRGWCFGADAFKADMLERIESLSGKRESFSGEQVQLHDQHGAEQLLQEGLRVLDLAESRLLGLRKGAEEKKLLAWLIRRNSVVSNAWIAKRLDMGRADCLSRYPKQIEESDDPSVVEKRERLREITILRD